jgi:zinc finger FYVE domain-containing protein 1
VLYILVDNDLTPEDYIRKRFQQSDQSIEAFSAFEYVGTQTISPPTDFRPLQETVKKHLNNSTVRSSRTSDVVFTALKVLPFVLKL